MKQPTLQQSNRLFSLQSEMTNEDALLLSQALRGESSAAVDFGFRAWDDVHESFPRTQAFNILTDLYL